MADETKHVLINRWEVDIYTKKKENSDEFYAYYSGNKTVDGEVIDSAERQVRIDGEPCFYSTRDDAISAAENAAIQYCVNR